MREVPVVARGWLRPSRVRSHGRRRRWLCSSAHDIVLGNRRGWSCVRLWLGGTCKGGQSASGQASQTFQIEGANVLLGGEARPHPWISSLSASGLTQPSTILAPVGRLLHGGGVAARGSPAKFTAVYLFGLG